MIHIIYNLIFWAAIVLSLILIFYNFKTKNKNTKVKYMQIICLAIIFILVDLIGKEYVFSAAFMMIGKVIILLVCFLQLLLQIFMGDKEQNSKLGMAIKILMLVIVCFIIYKM